jgi:hypothetical protein
MQVETICKKLEMIEMYKECLEKFKTIHKFDDKDLLKSKLEITQSCYTNLEKLISEVRPLFESLLKID